MGKRNQMTSPSVQITERIIIDSTDAPVIGKPEGKTSPDQSDSLKAGNFYRTMPIAS